jgi:cytochrome c-type biogenesis protein CcmH/NrfF
MTRRTVAVAAVILLFASPAHAASPERAATDLSQEIMSPFCPGVTLHECPSAEALRLRDRIEEWFASGMTRDEILTRLEDEYGAGVRATPAPEGMGLVAWVIVAAAVVAAVGLAVVLVTRWSRRSAVRPATAAVPAADRARLDDELARLRAGS